MVMFALAAAPCLAKDPKVLTDAYITDQVRLKLVGDQVVKGGALKVDVQKGVVTLSGMLERPNQKERAEKLTKKVKGVKQVINNITVRDQTAKR